MSGDTFKYFAYGSNMLTNRLRERCPSADPVGMGTLFDYELHWHKKSNDGSGKCDIVGRQSLSAFVLGVLFLISEHERHALDRFEGLGKGYDKIEVAVYLDGQPLTARTYKATNVDQDARPYTWYRDLVVEGAREHELDPHYIDRLRAVHAKPDNNKSRHDCKMRLITDAPR